MLKSCLFNPQVVHFRNLPFETTDEELRELCEVFGAVVKSKLNVGQNKNQAFVEFSHINDAIKLVAHYEVEANKPKVRHLIRCFLLWL